MTHARPLVAIALLAVVSAAVPGVGAQQPDPTGSADQRRLFNPLAQSLHWLRSSQVEKELQLAAGQKEKLAQIGEDQTRQMREVFVQLRNVKQADRSSAYYKLQKELADETETAVRKVLDPQQLDRLQQIMLQEQLRSFGAGANVLASAEIAQTLGITENQKAQLRDAQRQAQEELQQKTREFYQQVRADMLEKVLAVLTPEQRQKLDDLMGAAYEPQP